MRMYAKTKAVTAEKDIPCWKMLEIAEGKDGNPMYVTPYQFKPVPPEVMRGEETFKPNEKPFYYPEDATTDRGFIHTRNCGMIGTWETYVTMGVIESMPLECDTEMSGGFAFVPGYASSEIRITGIGCVFRRGEYVPTQIPEKVYEATGRRNRPEEKQE